MTPFRFGLAIAAAVVVLDQLSKQAILDYVMDPPRVIPLTPFLNVVMVWNRGASFGFLNIAAAWVPWLLSLFAVAVAAGLMVWLRRVGERWIAVALGLIIGGAIGNVIDRARFGAVADFIDFYVGSFHWPAFNVADSAITIGIVILVIDGLIRRGRTRTL